jgi:hypothetical protein
LIYRPFVYHFPQQEEEALPEDQKNRVQQGVAQEMTSDKVHCQIKYL